MNESMESMLNRQEELQKVRDMLDCWFPLISRFREWGELPSPTQERKVSTGIAQLAKLLDVADTSAVLTPEKRALCKALLGPYGRTVLKVLKIKREMEGGLDRP